MRINRVMIGGRCVHTPEVKFLSDNTAVANFSVAIRPWKADGETDFVDVTAWGQSAEFVGKHLERGGQVIVDGWLKQDKWTDKEGKTRAKVKVNASDVQVIWAEKDRGDDAGKSEGEDLPF